MKLLIDIIEWEYLPEKAVYKPFIWDLKDREKLMDLYLALANGAVLEMRAEADSEEALELMRGMVTGVGSCRSIVLNEEQKQALWFFQENDECYQQGSNSPGFIFIDPMIQPQNFADR